MKPALATTATAVRLLLWGLPLAAQAQQELPAEADRARLPEVTASTPRGKVAPFNVPGSVIVNEGNARYCEPAPGRNWTVGLSGAYRF